MSGRTGIGTATGSNVTASGGKSTGSKTTSMTPGARCIARPRPFREVRPSGALAALDGKRARPTVVGHIGPPAHIEETHEAPLPSACPACGGHLTLTRHATQYQEDLPVVRPRVRAFHIAIGQCADCGRRVQGRHPLQTSDALGAAAAQLGPAAVTLAVVLNKQLGLPLGKIVTLFRERFGLTVTAGGLVQAMHRAAHRAEPIYAALGQSIRGSPVVTADETGWKVDARLQWLWAYTTPDTTLYAIQPGRGFEEAAAVLGADFAAVLVRDGWSPYRRFAHAIHQTCLAHLLRRCRTLIRDHHDHRFAPQVQRVLQHALRVRDRFHHGAISAHGVAVARGHLQNQLNALIDRPGSPRIVQKFAAHLAIEFPAVFTFSSSPRHRRHQLARRTRPAARGRHAQSLWGQSRRRGAHTQEVLASVLRTIQQRRLDAAPIFRSCSARPTPSPRSRRRHRFSRITR